ncbi:MAG: family 16 glycoside hydrolase, partial [Actinomycetota bacterium]
TYYSNMKTADAWGTSYIYSIESDTYTLKSLGIDKTENTADDIIYVNGIMTGAGKYTALEISSPAKTLFSSVFDNLDGIKTIMGAWTANGKLNSSPSKLQNRALFGDPAWTDYEIKTNAVLSSGNGYGIYYRSAVTSGAFKISGYIFQYDKAKNSFLVNKLINDTETLVKSVKMPSGFSVYDSSHEIDVSISGDRHVIKVDGGVVLDFNDSSFATGQSGVRSWSTINTNNSVSFDNIEIKEIK